ncbi:hypothetical protein [Frankia sp. CcWB2]
MPEFNSRRAQRQVPARRSKPLQKLARDRARQARRRTRRDQPLPDYLARYASGPDGHPRSVSTTTSKPRPSGNSLKHLRPVPWTSLGPAMVLDARVDFSDCAGYKRRPVVAVRVENGVILAFPITTQVRRLSWVCGRLLAFPREAGLREAQSAILWRPVAIERSDVIRVLGRLIGSDLEEFQIHARAVRGADGSNA